ncbi:MAG: response regulator [Candidatus Saganbacteria bacterium]|nr:response regulator [Candidatus Saganbacteria bacterium]
MKKIMIVDDDEDLLTMIERRLTKANYEVIKVTKGAEVVEKAKAQRPDLILLDIMLPDMDGGEVEALLQEDDTTKNIPVVILTALYTKSDERTKGNYSGNNIFLAKPFEPDKMLKIINELIG